MKRVMIFIDSNNFESAVKSLYQGNHQRIDYEKLAQYIATTKCNGNLQRLYYYTASGSDDKAKAAATKRFVDTLNKKVPNCIAKTGYLKIIGKKPDGTNIYVEKGTDVNIAVDIVSLAFNNAYDEAVLLSADSDYEPAIQMARNYGKNVVVGVVDQQTAGYLKDICDDNFTLSKADISKVLR